MTTDHRKLEQLIADWAGEVIRFYAKSKLEPDEDLRKFVQIFLFGYGEIVDSVDALKLSEVLLKVAKPRSRKLASDLYLKYIINSYIQEMYILKKRLINYRTRLQRFYRRLNWDSEFEKATNHLPTLVSKSLNGIIETRGRHVHQERYTDVDLDITSQLSFVAKFNESFDERAREEYDWSKSLWHARVKANNQILQDLLNIYFGAVFEGVTDNGELVWPNKGFNADAGKTGAG